MKKLNRDVAAIPGLDFVRADSKTIGGRGRMDTFLYRSHFPELEGFPPTVRLEPGVQSGKQPTTAIEISSIVGNLLIEREAADELGVEGIQPFEMTLLHFRRTFVEKLFAIHGKVEQLKEGGVPLGRDVRHYADLHVLAARPEVTAMLASDEYEEIKADYDEKSRAFFPRSYRPPPDLRFTTSDALQKSAKRDVDDVERKQEGDDQDKNRSLRVGPADVEWTLHRDETGSNRLASPTSDCAASPT